MKNHVLLFILYMTLTSPLLQAMLKPLSLIEKKLVYREIKRKGPEALKRHIELNQHSALKIEAIFFKHDAAAHPLTRIIFNKIHNIEKKWRHLPIQIMNRNNISPIEYQNLEVVNYLGPNTRYYWFEQDGKIIPAIKVEAHLQNKKALLKLIDRYKE